MCFVGARGAKDFVLGIRQGEFFLFDPMWLYSKYSEFRGEFEMVEKRKKGYVATLPTSRPLLTLPPALKRRGSPRRQGLCSHLAHLWATSDFVPRSEAEGIPSATAKQRGNPNNDEPQHQLASSPQGA